MTPAELQSQIAGACNFALQNGCCPADVIAQLEVIKFNLLSRCYERAHREDAGPRIVKAPNGLKVN